MCRPAEFISGNNGIPANGRVFKSVYRRVNCGSPWSTSWYDYPSGPATRLDRSGCVHTHEVQGWRAPLPYTYRKHKLDPPKEAYQANSTGNCPTLYVEGIRQTVRSIWPYDPVFSQVTPYERTAGLAKTNQLGWVRTEAIAALDRSDLALGETFLERKQTYAMVLELIEDMIWFWRRLRAGDFPALRKYFLHQDPWDIYLRFRYGWRPLFSDLQGMLQWVELRDEGNYNRCRIRVRKTRSWPFVEDGSRPVDKSTFSWHITGNETVKVRYYYKPSCTWYITLASLGITPNVLWETMPFSFVVDWFLNVGTFLEAWAQTPGWQFLGGTETTFGKYQGEGTFGPGEYPKVTATPLSGEWVSFDRKVVVMPPRPTLAINPDILIGKMSNARIADATGLLIQSYRKTGGSFRK